jgi:hypothetical protein
MSTDYFEFKKQLRVPPQRVGVILRSIDKLTDTIQSETAEEISTINQMTVDKMTEEEVAQYLQGFMDQYSAGSLDTNALHSHTMFQAVLVKAQEIESARN